MGVSEEHWPPPQFSGIWKIILKLDKAQYVRMNKEWQASPGPQLPALTDPELPQSPEEEEAIAELTDPSLLDTLKAYVAYISAAGPLNPGAVVFYERLLAVAEKRIRGFE